MKTRTKKYLTNRIGLAIVLFIGVYFIVIMQYDFFYYYEIEERTDINALMSWACWAVPLIFTEAILQYRKDF